MKRYAPSAIATGAALTAALALSAPAGAQVRTATAWSGGPHLEVFAKGFAAEADKLTQGKAKFQIFPAGTIGSPLKVTETVQKRIAPAGHHWPGYDWGIDKTSVLFGGYVGSPGIEAFLHWIYEGGAIELWKQWRMEKFGVVALPCGSHSDEIHMHSHKKVQKIEDLKGLKLRTTGAWAEVASSLGASTVILAGGEVYPALERKVVDAIEWATPALNHPLGFHKIAKYLILPGVHQPGAVLECLFHKAQWESFDAATRASIELAAKKVTIESWMKLNVEDAKALQKLKADGVEVVKLDPSYIATVKKATGEWEDKTATSAGDWFNKVLKHKREFEAIWSGSKEYRMEFN
jgi:TRAP-type mannitol/chloroaromatic compound transport system substrate-binding protein